MSCSPPLPCSGRALAALLAGHNPDLTRLVILMFRDASGRVLRQRFALHPSPGAPGPVLDTPGGAVRSTVALDDLNVGFAAAATFGGVLVVRTVPGHSPAEHQVISGYEVTPRGLFPIAGHTIKTNPQDLVWTPEPLLLPSCQSKESHD